MSEKRIPDVVVSEGLSEPVGYDAAHPEDTLFAIGPYDQKEGMRFGMAPLEYLTAMEVQHDIIVLTSIVLKGVPSLLERIQNAQRVSHGAAPDDSTFSLSSAFGFGVLFRNVKREAVRAVYFGHCNVARPPTLHVHSSDRVVYETLTLCFVYMAPWTEGLPPA